MVYVYESTINFWFLRNVLNNRMLYHFLVKHGCILAGVKAYHPDGTEVKAPPSSKYSIVQVPSEGAKVDDQFPVLSVGNLPKLTAQEIYELQAVLQVWLSFLGPGPCYCSQSGSCSYSVSVLYA